MADGNVRNARSVTAKRDAKVPSDCDIDRVNDLCFKARSIVEVIRAAAEVPRGTIPDDAIPGACWAVECLIEEIEAVASTRLEDWEQTALLAVKEGCNHG